MAALPTTSYLILGLLARRDRSAYEVAQQLGRDLGGMWPRAERQLYNAPKRLVAEGLVRATPEAVGQRTRTRYTITRSGRAALARWFASEVHPPSLEFEGLARLLLSDQGSVEELRATLEQVAAQARADLDDVAAQASELRTRPVAGGEGDDEADRRHLLALALRFTAGHLDVVAGWAEWALAETAGWPDTCSPAASRGDRADALLDDVARLADRDRDRSPPRAVTQSGDSPRMRQDSASPRQGRGPS